jgi:hypothetical protein
MQRESLDGAAMKDAPNIPHSVTAAERTQAKRMLALILRTNHNPSFNRGALCMARHAGVISGKQFVILGEWQGFRK